MTSAGLPPPRIAILPGREGWCRDLAAALATAAASAGFGVDLLVDGEAAGSRAGETGARVVAFDVAGGLNPLTSGEAAGRLSAGWRGSPPDLVHAIGLRAAILAGSAALLAGIGTRIYGPTGLGRDAPGGLLATGRRLAARALLRGPLAGREVRYLLETEAEAAALGFPATEGARIAIAGTGTADLVAAALVLYRSMPGDSQA